LWHESLPAGNRQLRGSPGKSHLEDNPVRIFPLFNVYSMHSVLMICPAKEGGTDMDSTIVAALIGVVAALAAVYLAYYLGKRQAEKPRSDKELFAFWRNYVFNRRAFKGTFRVEQRYQNFPATSTPTMNPFDQAIEKTLEVISRGPTPDTSSIKGMSIGVIKDQKRREKMESVQKRLTGISAALADLRKLEMEPNLTGEQIEKREKLIEIIDNGRDEIIITLNSIWSELGIRPLDIPTKADYYYSYEE